MSIQITKQFVFTVKFFPEVSAHRQTAYDYNLSKTTLRMINKHVNRAT